MTEAIFPPRDHEHVEIVKDDVLLGYLVIDSSVGGRSCGGLRISSTVSVS